METNFSKPFKVSGVMPPELIFQCCEEVQRFLEGGYDSDNPKICIERATDLEIYLAQSAKMCADSEYHLNKALKSSIMEGIKQMGEEAMGVTLLKQYVASHTKDLNYLVKWTDRLNRAIVHSMDVMRTIISHHKSEMQNINFQK